MADETAAGDETFEELREEAADLTSSIQQPASGAAAGAIAAPGAAQFVRFMVKVIERRSLRSCGEIRMPQGGKM